MENKGIIYKLTSPSPSNKMYIGQTVESAKKRWNGHKNAAARFEKYIEENGEEPVKAGCRLLNKAIIKYGFDKFQKEVIGEFPEDDLDEKEQYYIQFYDTLAPKGYNLITGGNSNKQLSEETKIKISDSLRERPDTSVYRKSEETKNLPKYLHLYKENGIVKGYQINDHPDCEKKTFADKNKTKEENLQDAKNYLNGLDDGTITHNPEDISYRKKSEETKDLPEYINRREDTNGKIVYRILKHPKCGSKTFNDPNKTEEENLQDTLDYLYNLDNEIIEHEPSRKAPTIHKKSENLPTFLSYRDYGNGSGAYRIQGHPKCGSATFNDPDKTEEENLQDAKNYLKGLDDGTIIHVEKERKNVGLPKGMHECTRKGVKGYYLAFYINKKKRTWYFNNGKYSLKERYDAAIAERKIIMKLYNIAEGKIHNNTLKNNVNDVFNENDNIVD